MNFAYLNVMFPFVKYILLLIYKKITIFIKRGTVSLDG